MSANSVAPGAQQKRFAAYLGQNEVDHLTRFVTDMLDLVGGAKREGNPMVF